MKHVDVTDDSYAEYNEDFNKNDPKFKSEKLRKEESEKLKKGDSEKLRKQ